MRSAVLLCTAMLVAGAPAAAQAPAPGSADAAAARLRGVPTGPFPPLQPEPGDIWSDVRGWQRGAVPTSPAARAPPRARNPTAAERPSSAGERRTAN